MSTSYVERIKDVSLEDLRAYRRVVEYILSENIGQDFSCHQVCGMVHDALGRELGLRVVTGRFYVAYEHTWLALTREDGRDGTCIIDCYPVGAPIVPIILSVGWGSPWATLYREDPVVHVKRELYHIIDGFHGLPNLSREALALVAELQAVAFQ